MFLTEGMEEIDGGYENISFLTLSLLMVPSKNLMLLMGMRN